MGPPQGDPEKWREWWNDPSCPAYYFMGKDNITFHSQIWPSEMLAYNGKGSKGGETGPNSVRSTCPSRWWPASS